MRPSLFTPISPSRFYFYELFSAGIEKTICFNRYFMKSIGNQLFDDDFRDYPKTDLVLTFGSRSFLPVYVLSDDLYR